MILARKFLVGLLCAALITGICLLLLSLPWWVTAIAGVLLLAGAWVARADRASEVELRAESPYQVHYSGWDAEFSRRRLQSLLADESRSPRDKLAMVEDMIAHGEHVDPQVVAALSGLARTPHEQALRQFVEQPDAPAGKREIPYGLQIAATVSGIATGVGGVVVAVIAL
jgi:hypothetical protein